MLALIASIGLPLTLSVMAYIPYKYPFNNETGEITKAVRFFGVLVLLSIVFGVYLAWDSFITSKESKGEQTSLKNTISALNRNVKSLGHKIDSVGYKIDKKTGLLVPKTIVVHAKTTITNQERRLTPKNANEILETIMSIRLKDTITDKTILYFIANDSNLKTFSYDLEKFLKKKSFIIFGPSAYDTSIDGITVNPVKGFYKDRKIMQLVVGTSLTKGDVLIKIVKQ